MKKQIAFVAFMLAIVISSCQNQASNQSETKQDRTTTSFEPNDPSSPKEKKNPQPIPVGNGSPVATDSTPVGSAAPVPVKTDWDKKIIKTATLRLEVKDFAAYNKQVHQTVHQFGGYIAQEEQNTSSESIATTISIKVPVDQFDAIMNQLPAGTAKTLERKISTEDVTGQVVDTRSRLEAKRQMRLKYLDFLKQSKNMEEVLQVQNEINSIQEEIESAAGRMEYLTHSAAMSTINLSFYQPLAGFEPGHGEPSFFTELGASLKAGAEWLLALLLVLARLWPLLVLGTAALLIYKRRKFTKKQPA